MAFPGMAPGRSLEVVCVLCSEVVNVCQDREGALKLIAMHFHLTHPDHGSVILEGPGGDFLCHPCPYRCDLCSEATEPPWWTFTTRRIRGWVVEDPEWLVCHSCYPLVMAQNLDALVLRSLELCQRIYGTPAEQNHSRTTIALFLANLAGDPVPS